MTFRIVGLDPAAFAHLFALSEPDLTKVGARRVRIEQEHAAPCRISLEDAEIGETVVLLNHIHQPADTPYRQQGPIFIRDSSHRFDAIGAIPPALARRTLSLRGFDADHMMIEAELCEGSAAAGLIERFFVDRSVAYIHAHYARRGCFAALVERASH
ncbi:MAG: DUF1203 domain-containing protein [Hyphomonadaceae bacterium]